MPPRRRRVKPKARRVVNPGPTFAQLTANMNAPIPAVVPTGTGPSAGPKAQPMPPGFPGGPPIEKVGGITGPGGVTDTLGVTGSGSIGEFVTKKLPAYFKVGAGGLVMIVSSLALVYVAGRNTAPVKAAKLASAPILGATKAVAKVPRKTIAAPERPDIVRAPSASGKPKLRLVEPAKAPTKATTTINLRNASPSKRAQVRKMLEAG